MSMCLDKPGQRVLSSEHMGIMGYALCGAIAAAHLCPDAQKVAIAGDGGFQMSLQGMCLSFDYSQTFDILLARSHLIFDWTILVTFDSYSSDMFDWNVVAIVVDGGF